MTFGISGPTHVRFPGVRAGFAASAGFLFAAEGPADLGAGRADVHIRTLDSPSGTLPPSFWKRLTARLNRA